MWRDKDRKLKTTNEYVKADEKYDLHFGVSLEKRSQTKHVAVETKPANKHERTTTENREENSKSFSALSLFS